MCVLGGRGSHNVTLTSELVRNGFISFGLDMLGDLALIPDRREGLKRSLERSISEDDEKAIPGWDGILEASTQDNRSRLPSG